MPTHSFNLSKYKTLTLTIGLIGILIALFGLFKGLKTQDPRPVFSWLIGFSVWFGIGIGTLLMIMLFWVFDAGWSVIIRRQAEHIISIFPFLALLFLPLLLVAWFSSQPGILWSWMDPDLILPGSHGPIKEDPLYLSKSPYLNLHFFTFRVILYFFILTFISRILRKRSFLMDKSPAKKNIVIARFFSGAGIPLVGLVATFAAFDFFMSLSYQWFSTIYGVWFFATSMRAALAIIVIVCAALGTKGYLKGILNKGHFYLLGCMFLAFTVFWAYISFCQYFLIYNANIPEETFWYNIREIDPYNNKNNWWFFSLICLVLCNFIIPFLLLLFYKTKVKMKRLVFVSAWILLFYIADLFFNILPRKIEAQNLLGYLTQAFSVNIWDVSAIIGFGSICTWLFIKSTSKAQPIPVHDPRIEESLHCHE